MRIFVAINFDDETKEKILAVQRRLKTWVSRGNFTRAENLHLTLAFLGEIPSSELQMAKAAMAKTVDPGRSADANRQFAVPEKNHSNCKEIKQQSADSIGEIINSRLSILFDRSGHFSRSRGGDIWWIGIRHNNKLIRLQRRLSRELAAAGFELEQRRFTPHLTLARQVRLKNEITDDCLNLEFEPFAISVDRISLMKSERLDGVLTYSELWSINL